MIFPESPHNAAADPQTLRETEIPRQPDRGVAA
jgi:hypothetical protein